MSCMKKYQLNLLPYPLYNGFSCLVKLDNKHMELIISMPSVILETHILLSFCFSFPRENSGNLLAFPHTTIFTYIK